MILINNLYAFFQIIFTIFFILEISRLVKSFIKGFVSAHRSIHSKNSLLKSILCTGDVVKSKQKPKTKVLELKKMPKHSIVYESLNEDGSIVDVECLAKVFSDENGKFLALSDEEGSLVELSPRFYLQ